MAKQTGRNCLKEVTSETIEKTAKVAKKNNVLKNGEKLTPTLKKDLTDKFEDFLGKNPTLQTNPKGSDLILRSKDNCKQIRFDLSNPHGLEPHINIETFKPRNLFPGDDRMVQIENLHVFPRKT